jgi:hypothetical protein
MKCIHCGAEISENANFCPVCGQNSGKQPNFCMNCGSKVEWNMQFCETCGKPIEKLNQQQEEPEDVSEDVKEAAEKVAEHFQESPVQPQAPVQAPVQPQPVVHAAAPVASAGAQVGAEVVRATGKVAVEGVKKTVSTGKKIAIIAAVVVFIIGALTACLNLFVPAPDETVENFFASVEELDYEKMLGCMDKKTESTIRATLGITGDLLGSFTGISLDLEDIMALGPSMAPIVDTPDMGIESVETVFYSDCSQKEIIQYCIDANSGKAIPDGYESDNALISFLDDYNLTLPGLENLIAKTALVKLTLETGETMYLPLINEGWGDWRIPLMDLSYAMEGVE